MQTPGHGQLRRFLPEHWNCSSLGGILMSMRRNRWFRAVATVVAIWFPLIVGEPSAVHVCPAHSGVAMSTTSTVATAHHHGASHDSQPGHDHHDCSCINCCVGSVVAAPAVGTPVTLGRMRARVVRHFQNGVAVEFAAAQEMITVVQQNLRLN